MVARLKPLDFAFLGKGPSLPNQAWKKVCSTIDRAALANDSADPLLSFFNLAEAHVLSAIRKEQKLSLGKVRLAIEFLSKEFHSAHPLIAEQFFSNGVDLFVKALLGTKERHVLNASRGGQFALKEMLDGYLERIARDPKGLPIKLYPLTAGGPSRQEKVIVMTPDVSSRQPVIDRRGIRAIVIWNRSQAGESVNELADDYGIKESEVKAAIEYIDSIDHTNKAA